MRAVFAAGGTAGHVNPALAIAEEMLKNEPDSEIVFMGRADGMEAKLVAEKGYHLEPLDVRGFLRSLKPDDILFNLNALRCMFKSSREARAFLRAFKPDVVIGCGGYVSGPVLREAALLGIPTAIHEQNSFPGVTTRILSRYVDIIFAPNEDAAEAIGKPDKTVVAGNPVSRDIVAADRGAQRRALGVGERTCILSFGGSLGAATINRVAAQTMAAAKGDDSLFFVHATGKYGVEKFPQMLAELGVDPAGLHCRISTYIHDMPQCLAAADLVVSRSGAITVSELAAAGKASYLIPSPNVSENHQYYNALSLAKRGAAVVEEEKGLDAARTAQAILALAADRSRLVEMGVAARSANAASAAQQIWRRVKALTEEKKAAH